MGQLLFNPLIDIAIWDLLFAIMAEAFFCKQLSLKNRMFG
jgi:hypothetical protein